MRRPARKPLKKNIRNDGPKIHKPQAKKRYQDRDVRDQIFNESGLESYRLEYEQTA